MSFRSTHLFAELIEGRGAGAGGHVAHGLPVHGHGIDFLGQGLRRTGLFGIQGKIGKGHVAGLQRMIIIGSRQFA